ncbi:MAG: prolyl oligopeptidase family serine peptidase [Gemmatimonadetes bacterium]|nr:prolyl oligopeptidase family serine peptidase [Gemmatimonadota bacterium]
MKHALRTWTPLALAAAVAAVSAPAAPAQQMAGPRVALWEPPPARDDAFALTIQNVMRGPEHVGEAPSGVAWADDGGRVYFRWRPGGGAWDDETRLWWVAADGGEPAAVPEAEADSVAGLLYGGDVSPDRRWRVTAWDGDLWLVDRRNGAVRRLTETRGEESSPVFSGDGSRVFFRHGRDLFSLAVDGGAARQLTDIREGPEPAEEDSAQGHRRFLEEQQEELFEHVRRRRAREARQDSLEALRDEARPEPVWLESGERVGALEPSPDGRFVLVTATRPAEDRETVVVPDWVTESGYTEDLETRTKVGDVEGSSRVGLLRTETGEVTWLEPWPDDEDDAGEGATAWTSGWNDAGTRGLVASRSDDDEHLRLYTVEAATGRLTLLDHQRDEAWVGGPCRNRGCVGWVPGADRVWFTSEATGYSHLYTVTADGGDRRQLTSGEWEVLDVEIPEGEDHFLLTTNEGSPFNQLVYRMDLDGSDKRPLFTGTGAFEATPSPDGRRFAVVHSRADAPPELYLADRPGADALERVTTSPTATWRSFGWIRPEIVRIPAEDGALVPARIYRPSDMGAEPNGAGVIFVHGAGYLHNVHDYWSSYYREYMFNQFLAAAGYTVLDIDYRGSAGYGRDWRTAIYRWMGGKDLSDQVDGARWLVASEGVDPGRIGLYGGSYGGFITLMALFTAGDTFKSGAALRSVTDWAHYNDSYTSNILNDPQEDEEAYRRSSPIYFAENFRPDQHLLMLHGMVDTNVHFSDVVRLSQRLIELGKENWELAVYPVENHSFVEPASWTDEYRRIFELFERTLSRPGCTENGDLCPVPRGTAVSAEAEGRSGGR